ncbi:hypothetical protein F2Q69_00023814 [Brassica cretica]|uniref:Uncharacterized protein n=1 Tax=Brassica cretica TaxID=69181 RepID=A0A8S9QCV9_BRACR|nr:hypothetical protein F2Q69_00023814 [Brassica cretica]
MHGFVSYRFFKKAQSLRSDRVVCVLCCYVATSFCAGCYAATLFESFAARFFCETCGISEDAQILAKRQIFGSRIKVFDTMPRDVRDQCAGFRARLRFTPGFRGCDD